MAVGEPPNERVQPGGISMKQPSQFEDAAVDDVPVSPLLSAGRKNVYGSVPGLDDEELAEPDELERQVMREEWGPILALPASAKRSGFKPEADESGGVDWGAFASVDFQRTMPEFDPVRYKADKVRQQLKDLLIIISIVKERLPGKAKYQVMKLVGMGVIEPEHIVSEDMLTLARLYLRAKRLQKQVAELEEASWRRRRQHCEAWLATP